VEAQGQPQQITINIILLNDGNDNYSEPRRFSSTARRYLDAGSTLVRDLYGY
jgi:hypothetical protein